MYKQPFIYWIEYQERYKERVIKIVKKIKGNKDNYCFNPPTQPGLPPATTINLAVVGDSHVGFQNSQNMFNTLLQRVVSNGNKGYIIFGGD